MAEIDLVSSHPPWAPLPRLIGWDEVGDGSVYAAMRADGQSEDVAWRHPSTVRAAYVPAIAYSVDTLVSFVEGGMTTTAPRHARRPPARQRRLRFWGEPHAPVTTTPATQP